MWAILNTWIISPLLCLNSKLGNLIFFSLSSYVRLLIPRVYTDFIPHIKNVRNLTFFPKMWGIWLFSQKCEEFDFFPKMSANRRFLEKSVKTVSWICAERVSDFPRQTARGLMHQSDAFECEPMRVRRPSVSAHA